MKAALLGCWLVLCSADGQSTERIRYHFEREGMDVPVYTFSIDDSGHGTYTATSVVKPDQNYQIRYTGKSETMQPLDLTPELTGRLFAAVKASDFFRNGCASKAKNIADTGRKTLTYSGADGTGTCTYNYADKKPIVELTNLFQAMAFTLDEGRRLESRHKYDRLSLDPELAILVEAVKDGRALALSNIRVVLQSLVDDPEVLGRVRTRALKLLEQSHATP